MKRIQTARRLALVIIALMGLLTLGTAMAQATASGGHELSAAAEVAVTAPAGAALQGAMAPYFSAALVMGLACVSAAYAVGKVGAAALGAAAEKPELLGKAIVFVGLGEGIAIFGLIISLMIINKIP